MTSWLHRGATIALIVGGSWTVGCSMHHHAAPPPQQQPARGPAAAPPPAAPAPGPATGAPLPARLHPLPQQPPLQEPPAAAMPATPMPRGIVNGRPGNMRPGAPVAFWIWRGPRGNWHLRTTTTFLYHHFRGRVASPSGPLVAVRPSRVEFQDRIVMTPRAVWFSFATQGHVDGFDFRPPENGCVRFDLFIDRGPHAERVFIGASEAQPPHGPFLLCP